MNVKVMCPNSGESCYKECNAVMNAKNDLAWMLGHFNGAKNFKTEVQCPERKKCFIKLERV